MVMDWRTLSLVVALVIPTSYSSIEAVTGYLLILPGGMSWQNRIRVLKQPAEPSMIPMAMETMIYCLAQGAMSWGKELMPTSSGIMKMTVREIFQEIPVKRLRPPEIFLVLCPATSTRDGFIDLFIGARIVPGNYGLTPRSFLLGNLGKGVYQDISTRPIGTLGMVCDADWMDADQDGDPDLIVIGEWMSPMVFENNQGRIDQGRALVDSPGWWTTMEVADLDNDGNEDLILGNWGLNTKLKASVSKPLSLYVKDFDNNGKTEFILNWYPSGDNQSYPFASKMDITQQIPILENENLKYEDYAHRTYETLIPEDARKNALTYKAHNPGNQCDLEQWLKLLHRASASYGPDKSGLRDRSNGFR